MAKEGQTPVSLDALAGAVKGAGRLPPVHLWNPPFCGDLDMRIAADGTWYYLKTPIGRPALVKLFASVLKREEDRYFLVTPVEKCGITVEDVPFVAVELRVEAAGPGQTLLFRTNVDDWVPCGAEHSLRFEPEQGTGGLRPYLHVRSNLWARVKRALFFDLVDLGEERDVAGVRTFGVVSGGAFFAMAPVDEIEDLLMRQRSRAGVDFFERARSNLTLDVPAALTDHAAPATRGDLDLDPEMWERAGVAATRPAAVLVPVVARPEPTVLLTLRTAALPSHAGQIAFPGGKIDPDDQTPVAAALREAHEEIGLDGSLVEPIGYLDLYLTFSGFRILPTLARVDPSFTTTLNRAEVDDAFEVPLAFLMDAQNHALHSRDWKGVTRRYYAMPFGERYIWGVTAGILRNLYERVYGIASSPEDAIRADGV